MKNIIKFIALIFIGGVMIWACDSFRVSDSSSQTNIVSNNSTLTNGSVISNNSGASKTSGSSNEIITNGAIVEKKAERKSLCGSGFSEIPPDLEKDYLYQVEQFKYLSRSSKVNYPLKTQINFYGFTYPFNNATELKRDETQCAANKPLKPEEIKFVKPQVNELVKKYISAVIYNEKELISSKGKINASSNIIHKIDLCLDIECGTENPNGEEMSFDILTDGDLQYARSYSDTLVSINALNSIGSISQSDESQYLTDSEINQMLTAARNIAIAKAKQTNK